MSFLDLQTSNFVSFGRWFVLCRLFQWARVPLTQIFAQPYRTTVKTCFANLFYDLLMSMLLITSDKMYFPSHVGKTSLGRLAVILPTSGCPAAKPQDDLFFKIMKIPFMYLCGREYATAYRLFL